MASSEPTRIGSDPREKFIPQVVVGFALPAQASAVDPDRDGSLDRTRVEARQIGRNQPGPPKNLALLDGLNRDGSPRWARRARWRPCPFGSGKSDRLPHPPEKWSALPGTGRSRHNRQSTASTETRNPGRRGAWRGRVQESLASLLPWLCLIGIEMTGVAWADQSHVRSGGGVRLA